MHFLVEVQVGCLLCHAQKILKGSVVYTNDRLADVLRVRN